MSGWPRKLPGVWQSPQPPKVTRYLPRATWASSARAAPANRSKAAMAADNPSAFLAISIPFFPSGDPLAEVSFKNSRIPRARKPPSDQSRRRAAVDVERGAVEVAARLGQHEGDQPGDV